jgi:hypothetical protein
MPAPPINGQVVGYAYLFLVLTDFSPAGQKIGHNKT